MEHDLLAEIIQEARRPTVVTQPHLTREDWLQIIGLSPLALLAMFAMVVGLSVFLTVPVGA